MMDMNVLENRYLVEQALLNIDNMGVERIIKSGNNGKTEDLTGDIIGFTIAPLINGTARMGNIQDAIELLLSDEDKEVKKIRLRMHKANEARKKLQKEMTDKFTQDIDTSNKAIFIITDESSSGMNGLIAQDISQRYSRPVFVGRNTDGVVMGSVRSYGGIPMKTVMQNSGLIDFASGHEGAFGLGFDIDNLDEIYEYLDNSIKSVKVKDEVYYYDIQLEAEEVLDVIDIIESFNKITGTNCKKIIVRIDDLMVGERKILGANRNTVKIHTMDDIDLIKFRVDEEYANDIEVMDSVSIIGDIRWNVWIQFRPQYTVHKTMQVIINDYNLEV